MSTDLCKATGKQGYSSRTAATKARRAIVERTTTRYGPPISAYRCRACGLWHIGRER